MFVGRSSRKNLVVERRQARNASGYVPGSLDEENRSVEVVAATETPAEVYDPARWEVVTEVLLMSGCQIPDEGQIPITVQHENSARSVIGSLRKMSIEGGDKLVGQAYFSTSSDAEPYWVKVREGHLNRFSITYPASDRDSVYIAENETAEIAGRRYEGPMLVTKKWTPKALGLVLFGADKNAKARKEVTEMKPDDQQAIDDVKREEKARILEINAMCQRFGCEDLAASLINDDVSIDMARKQVMDHLTKNDDQVNIGHMPPYPYGTAARVGTLDEEKRSAAIIDGLTLREGVEIDNPASGADEYRETPLSEIARECLIACGVRVTGMSRSQIVKEALVQRAANTSDFPALMAATANKVLRASFVEAPSTYQQWVKQTSGRDFKEMSRNQISEAPDLDQIPELGVYKHGEFGDAKEVFQIHKFGKLFAISREAIINDDLSALTSVPKAFALSAKRKVNQSVYDVLTTNAAMSDGTALFHANHNNLNSGAAGAPSETTLSGARLAMRKQTGLANAILNISPKHLIAPAALETGIDVLLNSLASIDDNKNSQVKNPFHGKLEPVIEAYLDATSATAWYLAANHGAIDTIELCFLHGRKEPYLETRDGWTVDGVEYKVRIEFGVKAIDWRGLQKNNGA